MYKEGIRDLIAFTQAHTNVYIKRIIKWTIWCSDGIILEQLVTAMFVDQQVISSHGIGNVG